MTTISPKTFYLLSLLKLKSVGPAALKKVALIPGFETKRVEEIASAVPQVARALEGGASWDEAQDWVQMQAVTAEKHKARIVSAVDAEYPLLLAATKDDPFILYLQGELARPEQRSVAVIGTREPTQHGAVVAQRVTTHFGQANWSIVSGLAIGCDGLAHQAAIDCGAHTVAVLAHGLHMIAPSKHKKLSQDILAAGGALVSEYPFGQAVQAQQYVKRDRTQAGMALGVVMVQSDIKGGSLYASRATLEYGRWLAVPYPTDRDLENREPKVQANLVIADGAPHERADLLRCTTSALNRVIVLRGREDYARLSESSGLNSFEQAPSLDRHHIEASTPASADGPLFSLGVEATAIDTPVEEQPEQEAAMPPSPETVEANEVPDEGTVEQPHSPASPPAESPMLPPPDALPTAPSRPDLLVTSEKGSAWHLLQVKRSLSGSSSQGLRQILLYLSPPKDEALGAAFGLWTPPKIGSKEFKEHLGDARDDRVVREFYARYKRLHGHLAELHRKMLDAKSPRTHDQMLTLRLVGEEVVLHLTHLARSSASVEVLSKALRRRVVSEDWIERDTAHQQSLEHSDGEANETRRELVDELSAILIAGLQSYVIDDEGAANVEGASSEATQKVSLHQLVERLNSVLIAAF